MRGEGASSLATAGCGVFSLLGVLITVGLIAWLGSRALPGDGDRDGGPAPSEPSTTEPADSELAISLEPSEGLEETSTVVAVVEGLEPGATYTVATCVRGGGRVTGADAPCDEASTRSATVAAAGPVTVPYHPARIVTAGGLPFDCGSAPGTCEIRVTQTSGPSGGPALTGSAPISFRADLPPPPLTLPEGG